MTCGRIITPADYDDVVCAEPAEKAMNDYWFARTILREPLPPIQLADGSVILRVKGQRPVRYVRKQ